MVDGEIKNGSAAFSWADEVEKEEEEQARFQEHQKQKPNPFGSARPREVVLLEKGIDWRKFDFDCQLPSHIRQVDDPKEKIPVCAAPGIDRIHSDTPSKCLKLELEGANSDLKRSEILRVPLAVWNQIPVPFVPPLRYPPKNVIPSLSESGFHYYLHESGKGQQDFKNKGPLKPEKENAFTSKGPKGFIALKIIAGAAFFLTITGKYCMLSKGASLRRITQISSWGNQLLMGRTRGKQQLVEYSIQIQLSRDLAKIVKKIMELVMRLGRA